MPENEFEKQVQQKMNELSFVPSDAVWPEVEKQIAERKKRRALFFWLPLALLIIAGAGWIFMSGTKQNEFTQPTANHTSNKTLSPTNPQPAEKKGPAENTINSSANAGVKKQGDADKENNVAVQSNNPRVKITPVTDRKNEPATSVPIPATVTGKTNNNRQIEDSKTTYPNKKADRATLSKNSGAGTIAGTTITGDKKMARLKNKRATLMNNPQSTAATKQSTSEPIVQEKQDATEVTTEAAAAETISPGDVAVHQNNELQQPPVADSTGKLPLANTDTITAVAAVKKQASKKSTTKLDWGIQARGGFSNVSSGLSGVFSGSQSYDVSAYASNFSNSSPTNANNSGGLYNGSSAPSGIRKGVAYSAGVFIRKPFGKNAGFSAGLNYSYFSNQLNVGAKVDSNKALVQYKPGQLSDYVNRFHFIDIPLLFEKQLGNTSRFSLSGGLSFSYLFASNALFYDAKNNVYAAGKDHINKLQVSLLAGASYRLWQKHLPVEIGPGFSYGMGNLFDHSSNGGRHLFFAGLTARMFLSR